MGKNIGWVTTHLRQQTDCLDDQERDNQHSFDSINSDAPRCEDLSTMVADTRPQDTIHNFMYTDPVTAAEATMPLQALIAAFSTDDAAPLAISSDWAKASTQLSSIMDQLDAAGRQLSATTIGTSFDMAREAIDSVVRTGRIVAANAQIMSTTVAQFPTIRTANLAALHAIEASTATITDPAAKLAAEQSAVATFVSTQLQPSLELVRPPIMNLGVPIVGHTGGGVLTTSTVGQGSTVTPISQITGLTTTAASTATHAFGQAADAAAGSAGRGNEAAVAASAAQPAPVASTPQAPSVTGAAPTAPAASGGLSQPAPSPVVSPQSAGGLMAPASAGGVGATGGGVASRPGVVTDGGGRASGQRSASSPAPKFGGQGASRGGVGQRLPQLPQHARQAVMAREVSRQMAQRVSTGTGPGLGTGSGPGAGMSVGGGSAAGAVGPRGGFGRVSGTTGFGTGGAGAAGFGAGAGGRAASRSGGGRAAAGFKFGPEDRAYFTRLLMGKSAKTVRKIIR
ncbi:hypothetical protein CFAL_06920 [Corynebacterium falsenii DSM 44353]|uniref:hypothetical protein n=1 Tax=Corynebacterium falsenii TaxID=108486 RepID=UPI0003E93E84|nr:hypothetical protein [Corynebacterium falsenii]AHI04294.1 hypothetical protein CFAL_06920 [Corynebacterium falsenii DSM 44353]UBI04074.1 hypothetical protein LA343_08820 [Corynebacterium falsenii]